MGHFDLVLAALALALVTITWLDYFWRIARHRVPRRPRAHVITSTLGIALALAAVAWGPARGQGVSWIALGLTPLSVGMGGFFLWLLPQAALPEGELVVSVGDALPAFSAWDHRGERFDSASLAGDRVLLKFVRGHW